MNAKHGLLAAVVLCSLSTLGHGYVVLVKSKQGQSASDYVTRSGLSFLLGAWCFYQYRQQSGKEKESTSDRPFASLVVLLRKPPKMTEATISAAASKGLSIKFSSAPDAENRISGQAPVFLVQLRGHMFVVNNYDGPYFRNALKDAQCIPDEQLQSALRNHSGWMSMDLIQYPDGASVSAAYRLMGPVLAELCGCDCVAFHCPEAGYWAPWNDEQLGILRSSDPLMAMESGDLDLLDLPEEAPVMLQAAETARSRWEEFAQAFEKRTPGQAFYVKVRMEQNGVEEYPWISVTAIDRQKLTGTIDAELESIAITAGSKIEASFDNVWDWMIVPPGGAEPIGFFTQEAARV